MPTKPRISRQPQLQVVELRHRARQQEVERPQPQDGEDVRGVDQEGILRDGQHRGDGIHGEHQIGAFHHQQHQEERRRHQHARMAHEEALPLEVLGDGHDLAEEADERVALRLDLRLAAQRQLEGGEDQERAEDVHQPVEAVQQRRARADEDAAHDQRAEHPPEEDAALVERRDPEHGEDQHEDEEVIDAEGLLDQIGGEELQRGFRPPPEVDAEVEKERHPDPDRRPQGRRCAATSPLSGAARRPDRPPASPTPERKSRPTVPNETLPTVPPDHIVVGRGTQKGETPRLEVVVVSPVVPWHLEQPGADAPS